MKRDEISKFNVGDDVLVWYPPQKLDTAHHGPFIIRVAPHAVVVPYFRRLVDRDNIDADSFEVHVSRVRFVNAARTTVDRLLAHGLGTSYDVVTGIVSPHVASHGSTSSRSRGLTAR